MLGDDGEKSRPLQWDDGPPWELCLEVLRDEPEEHWRLSGSLRRADDTMSLDDARLVIPREVSWSRRGKVARVQGFRRLLAGSTC